MGHRKTAVDSKASIIVRSAGAYEPNGSILDDGRCSPVRLFEYF